MSKEKVARKTARKARRADLKSFNRHRKLEKIWTAKHMPTWKTVLSDVRI